MGFIRPSVLLFALIITAPAVYRYANGQLDITSLLARFLIAVPIAAILIAGLRFVTAGYGRQDEEEPAVPVTPTPMDQQPARPSS
jgi:hypothetical protein